MNDAVAHAAGDKPFTLTVIRPSCTALTCYSTCWLFSDGGLHLDDLGVDAGQYRAMNTSDARAGEVKSSWSATPDKESPPVR